MAYPQWGDLGEPKKVAGREPAFSSAGVTRRTHARAFADDYETERDTTSFSIVDQYGNAVSCTPTLGGGFGAGVVVGNTGLLLNNGDPASGRRRRIRIMSIMFAAGRFRCSIIRRRLF